MNKLLSKLLIALTTATLVFASLPLNSQNTRSNPSPQSSEIQEFDFDCSLDKRAEIETALSRIESETQQKIAILCIEASSRQNVPQLVLFTSRSVNLQSNRKITINIFIDTIKKLTTEINQREILAEQSTEINQSDSSSYKAPYKEHSKRLYDLLIKPFEEKLKDVNILMFAVDPKLPLFPPGVLYDEEQHLIEKFLISVIPHPTSIIAMKDHLLNRNLLTQSQKILVMGTEEFKESQLDFSSLVDLEELISNFSDQNSDRHTLELLLHRSFSKRHIEDILQEQEFGWIYIFSHAISNSSRPEESFIQLYDDKLSLENLASLLKDRKIDLLNLGTCQIAGDTEDTENSESGRFHFSNLADLMTVNTVLASQWEVEYIATMVMIQQFHRSLTSQLDDYREQSPGQPQQPFKAEALQKVQIAMLKNQIAIENGEFVIHMESEAEPERIRIPRKLAQQENLTNADRPLDRPYYWAAFTLVGSPW
jgi:CHAT domain-containing protein